MWVSTGTMSILITGVAGFIGFHLARRLLAQGVWVYGVDNLSDTYDRRLKQDRLAQLQSLKHFRFQLLDLADRAGIAALFQEQRFAAVIHLATQTSTEFSQAGGHQCFNHNSSAFFNLLEECRQASLRHFVFASCASVYGANAKFPFSVGDRADYPISLEAAAQKTRELIAHVYSHQYQLPITGLRLFTVYGPWGRPDMVYFQFVQAIETGHPIVLPNFGRIQRDLIYIDDVIEAFIRVLEHPPQHQRTETLSASSMPNGKGNSQDLNGFASDLGGFIETKYINGCGPYLYRRYRTADGKQRSQYLGKGSKGMVIQAGLQSTPYKIYNLGSSSPMDLITLLEVIERVLGKRAQKHFLGLPPGEMIATCAVVDDLVQEVGYQPRVSITEGMQRFVHWYREYFQIQ